MKKIFLVDVSSLFFRAYYAIRPLSSPSGLPVNAIYGFLSMLIKLLKAEKPEYIAFCYDRKEPSFRKDLYEDYKANRTEMPEDLGKQIPYIKKLADVLGIPSFEVPNYEADDLIGTLTEISLKKQFEVVVVSGDKDFGQIVKPHVILWDTMKDTRIDVLGVKEKWGIEPAKFIDYLALVGDSSDNIPGVEGIGPKGAQKILDQFNSVEDLYERINEIESVKLKEKLLKSKDMAFLSKKLVTIAMNVPMSDDMATYRRGAMKENELRELLRELNFKTFEKTLLAAEEPAVVRLDENKSADGGLSSEIVNTNSSYKILSGELSEMYLRLDLNLPLWSHLSTRGVFFSQNDWIFHCLSVDDSSLSNEKLTQIQWAGFDLKKTWGHLHCPIDSTGKVHWDSMLAAYILKAGDTSHFEAVVKDVLHCEVSDLSQMSEIFEIHKNLQLALKEKIQWPNGLQIVETMDFPLAQILYKMERRGVRLDLDYLQKFSLELEKEIRILEKEIHQVAGEVFNIASPKQLGVILFQKLGLEAIKKTKTGFSTDTDVLEKLNHPIALLVLQYREFAKLKSTYVDALPALMNTETHRVHTHFNQALTSTGRLSSTNPNLQNIPIRTLQGQRVRKAFIAKKDQVLLSLDYSQIELRILAHISDDKNMKKAFIDDLDIHTATAAEIYSLPLSAVTADLRRAAKAVNFGIAYGQGAFGLAENLGISRTESQEIIKRYFEKFPGVKEYMDSMVKFAYEKGYVETLMGRRRYLPELQAKNGAIKKFGERAAINAPIQGTASDLVKNAMITIDKSIKIPMLLQVHDELIFEASQNEVEAEQPMIKKIMENAAVLSVPLKVNASFGQNWDEAH
ncbi:MAG: DNA polymerase I [Bdellovibrionota bacterium]